jgi:DNA mismatch repair protein MutL
MWQLLNAATREGLGKFNVAPSIDFDQQGSIDIPIAPKSFEGLKAPSISVDPNYNPFDQKQKYTQNQQYQPEYTDLLYGNTAHNFDMQNDEIVIQSGITNSNNDIPAEQGRNFLLLKNKYILTPVKSGLMVIDQHRAHQRILYEQFMITLTNEDKVCQQLLFPQSIELNKSDSVIMNTILPELNIIGFDIHEFGPDTYIINGIPAFIDDSDATQIIEKILEDFKTGVPDLKEQAREKLAIGLAKASAIRYGHQLKPDEAGALIDNLFACQTPNYSPTGKPIIEIIQIDEIEKKMR